MHNFIDEKISTILNPSGILNPLIPWVMRNQRRGRKGKKYQR